MARLESMVRFTGGIRDWRLGIRDWKKARRLRRRGLFRFRRTNRVKKTDWSPLAPAVHVGAASMPAAPRGCYSFMGRLLLPPLQRSHNNCRFSITVSPPSAHGTIRSISIGVPGFMAGLTPQMQHGELSLRITRNLMRGNGPRSSVTLGGSRERGVDGPFFCGLIRLFWFVVLARSDKSLKCLSQEPKSP